MTTVETEIVGAEGEYVKAKTLVLWDIENCEVPRGWDANMIAQNVSSALLKMNYCGSVSITAYGDTSLIPLHVQHALSSTGVGLHHVPAGVKDASDKKILVDMLLWAVDNPAPANYMLISGDRDFSNALHQLSMRRYNILLAQPPRASAPLVAAARYVWLWTSLASGGPPLTSGESSPLSSKGRSNEVSKQLGSEQAQSSRSTDLPSVGGGSKDHKTNENSSLGRSSEETRRNMPQNGKGGKSKNISVGPVELPKEVWEKLKNENYKKASDGKAKPNADYKCRLCNVTCQRQIDFDSHLRGQKHTTMLSQSEALKDAKKLQEKGVVEKDQPREIIVKPQLQSQHAQENTIEKHVALVNQSQVLNGFNKFQKKCVGEKDHPREIIAELKPNTDYFCRLCNVKCPSQIDFDSHLRGKKHTVNVSQSEALTDSKKLQEKGVSEKDQPKKFQLQSQNTQKTTTTCSEKHVTMVKQSEVLTDSRKLEEKGVGETRAQAQENSKWSEKHVTMLNQSEALTNSRKLEENGVEVKVQSIGSFLEPRLPSPKNTKISKKQNKVWGETAAATIGSDDAECIVSNKPIKEPQHAFTELKRESLKQKETRHPLDVGSERVKLPPDWHWAKNSPKIVFDSYPNSQNHAVVVKELRENSLVDPRIAPRKLGQSKCDQEKETTRRRNDLWFHGAQRVQAAQREEVNEINKNPACIIM